MGCYYCFRTDDLSSCARIVEKHMSGGPVICVTNPVGNQQREKVVI
ncbi:MAG TPA: hypothetical protein QGF40_05100 [Candidatus Marinimicrobia bacterium]|nr:hypothetical protein [Candidatus Neomarinimicrobiota bacterium]